MTADGPGPRDASPDPEAPPTGSSGTDVPRVVLRPMLPADLPGVVAVERAVFSTPWTPATFTGLLRRDNARLWVAEAGGTVVGYAVVWSVLDQAELGNLAVAPEWRRRGIGTRLLERVLDAMAKAEIRELFLEVRVSNEAARDLYSLYDFEPVGRRSDYYTRPTEDALVLRRLFDPPEDAASSSS